MDFLNRYIKNKKNDKTEKEENETLIYDFGNGIFYCYNPAHIIKDPFYDYGEFFVGFYTTSDEKYRRRIKMEVMFDRLCQWGTNFPNDATFILAAIRMDIYNILSDDDIDRLKRKADSLNPTNDRNYSWLQSGTTLSAINKNRLAFKKDNIENFFDRNYYGFRFNEQKLKNIKELYKDVVYKKQKYENASFFKIDHLNSYLKSVNFLIDILENDNDLVNRIVAYSCLRQLPKDFDSVNNPFVVGVKNYYVADDFIDSYFHFYSQAMLFKLKNWLYNNEL